MSTPKPGQAVRGSASGRPIMVLLDLLGRRWVLRILWELRDEHMGFRELQTRCDSMSSSVLAQRLQEMQEADVLVKGDDEKYCLTEEGKSLLEALHSLNDWAARWAMREQTSSKSE